MTALGDLRPLSADRSNRRALDAPPRLAGRTPLLGAQRRRRPRARRAARRRRPLPDRPGGPDCRLTTCPSTRSCRGRARAIAARIEQVDNLGAAICRPADTGRATLTVELALDAVAVPGAPRAGATVDRCERPCSSSAPATSARFKADGDPAHEPGRRRARTRRRANWRSWSSTRRTSPGATRRRDATSDVRQLRPVAGPARPRRGRVHACCERPGGLAVLTRRRTPACRRRRDMGLGARADRQRRSATSRNLDRVVAQAPDHALSRLLSPRRLRPGVAYHAFVVPAFETGRLRRPRARRRAPPRAQQPSWGAGERPARCPVYHDWSSRPASPATSRRSRAADAAPGRRRVRQARRWTSPSPASG